MEKINWPAVPQSPGVYFFRDARGRILYIGKAANVRTRLRSYFRESAALEPAKQTMLREAKKVTWRTTDSSIEALILEAQLIKEERPPYNVVFRDDKQYFFVGFTREDFPRVFLTHQLLDLVRLRSPQDARGKPARAQRGNSRSKIQDQRFSTYIGPFTEGGPIKRTLKLLRRAFPYCTHPSTALGASPSSALRINRTIPARCLYRDLKLCPLPKDLGSLPRRQAGGIQDLEYKKIKTAYQKNIKAIRNVLSGKRRNLVQQVMQDMQRAAKEQRFERAAELRDQVRSLENIFAHQSVVEYGEQRQFLTRSRLVKDLPAMLERLLPQRLPWRIEGYDISNIQGTSATGSMVVFRGTEPEKPSYRKFRIKTVRGAHDIAMLKEVFRRRLRHPEWPMPDIMLIDGGKAQLGAAREAVADWQTGRLADQSANRPIAQSPVILALAKRNEELYYREGASSPIRLPKNHPFLLLMMHVRDEAHRCAKQYHHKRREMEYRL